MEIKESLVPSSSSSSSSYSKPVPPRQKTRRAVPDEDRIEPLEEERSFGEAVLDVLEWIFAPCICLYECFCCCFHLCDELELSNERKRKNAREIGDLADFDPETFQKDPAINWEVVKKTAPAIDLDFIRNVNISLDQLPLEYDRLFEGEVLPETREALADFIKFAKQNRYDDSVPKLLIAVLITPKNQQYYFHTLRLVLKNLIFELQSDDTALPETVKVKRLEKKKIALISLAETLGGCAPRRLEEALRLLKQLLNREETVEDQLSRFLEALKEEILLEQCQKDEIHVINHIRSVAGDDLGLDQSKANLDDPAKVGFRELTRERLLHIFQKHFTPERVCEALRLRIVEDGKNQKYLDFLSQDGLLTDDEKDKLFDYKTPIYFKDNEITQEGVKLVLQKANLWPFL